ncbi:glycosyltransferase family 9 protein [Marinomonas sp. RSW2]|uniref:Glycosyltransferase family 9 protein n=1 Tax=Marinomonas maritima TaxID=2940935 RepID=A0ABT5WBA5_9GAMM|nr:glycosyltransferase family 9 protein [Marinomonas maritima]MDE8601619.1 glycosyltransferase family 9 protein [Marinomonas maritima]
MLTKIGNFILKVMMFVVSKKSSLAPNKIAIYRFGSLGDSIVAMPALSVIKKRFPNAEIHVLCRSERKGLINYCDLLDSKSFQYIFDYSGLSTSEMRSKIKLEKYDLWIELPSSGVGFIHSFKKIIYLKSCDVKSISGHQTTPGNNVFLSKYYKKYFNFERETTRLLRSIDSIERNENNYFIEDYLFRDLSFFEEKNSKILDYDIYNEFLIFAPCSKKLAGMWPIEFWRELLRELQILGIKGIFIGSSDDSGYIDLVLDGFSINQFLSVAGKFDILQSAALIKKSRMAICVDSGPLHMSYALNKKLIAIFSARDYVNKWFPPENIGVTLRHNEECSPCFRDNCPINNTCMRNISVEMVLNEVKKEIYN